MKRAHPDDSMELPSFSDHFLSFHRMAGVMPIASSQFPMPWLHGCMQSIPDTSSITSSSSFLNPMMTSSDNVDFNGIPMTMMNGPVPSSTTSTPSPLIPSIDASAEFDFEVHTNIELLKGKRIKVTLGELRRRVSYPEFTNLATLTRLMRVAKTATAKFQRKLTAEGFKLMANENVNHGAKSTTILSGMLEVESMELARDYSHFVINELHVPSIIASILRNSDCSREQFMNCASRMRMILISVKEHLLSAGRKPAEAESQSHPSMDAQSVQRFSLITHGFGPLATVAVIDGLIKLVYSLKKLPSEEEIQKLLEPIMMPTLNSFADSSIISNCSSNDSGFFQSSPSTSYSVLPTMSSPPATVSHNVYTNNNDGFDAVWLAQNRDDDKTIFDASVLPRLGYDDNPIEMTRGELRRRIFGPEHLNVSLICSYIRKGKMRNTLQDLRKKLEDNCVAVQSYTRKGITPRTWTSIAEREAIQLAAETANELRMLPTSQGICTIIGKDPAATCTLRIILELIRCAFKSIGPHPSDVHIQTAADIHLYRFALLTHHFGHSFFVSVTEWLSQILKPNFYA